MKVDGVSTESKDFGPLTFRRGDAFVAFFARPLWDYDAFYEAFPEPVPPANRFSAGGGKVSNPDDRDYKATRKEWLATKFDYYLLYSLTPSAIEWDTERSLEDPTTWAGVDAEIKESLANFEYQRVIALVDEANALDERKLAENTATFFQLREASTSPTQSQTSEPENTLNGEHASE